MSSRRRVSSVTRGRRRHSRRVLIGGGGRKSSRGARRWGSKRRARVSRRRQIGGGERILYVKQNNKRNKQIINIINKAIQTSNCTGVCLQEVGKPGLMSSVGNYYKREYGSVERTQQRLYKQTEKTILFVVQNRALTHINVHSVHFPDVAYGDLKGKTEMETLSEHIENMYLTDRNSANKFDVLLGDMNIWDRDTREAAELAGDCFIRTPTPLKTIEKHQATDFEFVLPSKIDSDTTDDTYVAHIPADLTVDTQVQLFKKGKTDSISPFRVERATEGHLLIALGDIQNGTQINIKDTDTQRLISIQQRKIAAPNASNWETLLKMDKIGEHSILTRNYFQEETAFTLGKRSVLEAQDEKHRFDRLDGYLILQTGSGPPHITITADRLDMGFEEVRDGNKPFVNPSSIQPQCVQGNEIITVECNAPSDHFPFLITIEDHLKKKPDNIEKWFCWNCLEDRYMPYSFLPSEIEKIGAKLKKDGVYRVEPSLEPAPRDIRWK